MSIIDVINRLPSLWLLTLYIGTPVTFIVINIYNVISIQNKIKDAGALLYTFPGKEVSKKQRIICIAMMLLSIFASMFNRTIGFIFLLYALSNLTWIISESAYFGKNGIYENGIINHRLINWGSIFSWRIEKEKLELLNRDGIKKEYVINENIDKIIKVLERNKIKQEK